MYLIFPWAFISSRNGSRFSFLARFQLGTLTLWTRYISMQSTSRRSSCVSNISFILVSSLAIHMGILSANSTF